VQAGVLLFRPLSRTGTAAGLRAMTQMLFGTRKAADGYLRRRGLPRPRVPWATIKAAKETTH
jgi:hypothetical protein